MASFITRDSSFRTKVLTDNRSVLDEMASMLIEMETIDTQDIQDLLNRSEVKVANYI